jgi:uncharacterized pyridoxal phosphate-dependent enzyme
MTTSENTAAKDTTLTGLGHSGNVYEELGVTTLINGQGTLTDLGGSLMRPEVEAVMAMAGRHFVNISDLQVAVGKRIAEMLHLPDRYTAMVTSGAAAAMQSGLAGVLTGDDPKFIEQLPDLTGMKTEVIVQRSHRNPFDHQLRATGIKLIEIEMCGDLNSAVNPKTAMMHFTGFANAEGNIKVDEWPRLGKKYGIPTLIDAAADTLPVSHLWDFVNLGYDLVAFSGGKAIRGPQCAGLLLGRSELVAYALLNNSPHKNTLCRSQKVGKEEIVGMLKALESYLNEDHDALNQEWQRRLEVISAEVATVPGVTTSYYTPAVANHVPHMSIHWDRQRITLTPREVAADLRRGKPAIALSAEEGHDVLSISSFLLQPGEERIIAAMLAAYLRDHSS